MPSFPGDHSTSSQRSTSGRGLSVRANRPDGKRAGDKPRARQCASDPEPFVGNGAEAGAKASGSPGRPVAVRGQVRTISDGMFFERQPRHGGRSENHQGLTAVLQTPLAAR